MRGIYGINGGAAAIHQFLPFSPAETGKVNLLYGASPKCWSVPKARCPKVVRQRS
jgi:hypothetical protein